MAAEIDDMVNEAEIEETNEAEVDEKAEE